MPEGVIAGGWGYVIAAYGLTALFMGGYCVSLIVKLRRGRDKEQGS
jgi:hypothetical protein